MTTHYQESKLIVWILLPVLLASLLTAFVGLQLFQDGSSYLLEMLIDHSAVRNGRFSILLFQFPTIFLIKVFHRLGIDSLNTLPIIRLAFSLNYALTPFFSLLLSWLVVRRRRPELLIWAVLVILFVNLVNFSWVSELLIAVQFSCPFLLALLDDTRTKAYWTLFVLLTPFIFFLHPLVITLYFVMAFAAACIAYYRPDRRSSAMLSMILFLLAAMARGVYSFYSLSPYELSFASSGEVSNYFVISRVENVLFLVVACQLALLILLSQSIIRARWWIMQTVLWFVALQASVLFFFAVRLLVKGNLPPIILIVSICVPPLLYFWYARKGTEPEKQRLLYISYLFLAVAASSLLITQYTLDERMFTLKMGLDLLVVLFIMGIVMIDSFRYLIADERIWRFRLVAVLSTIFVVVMLAKSMMWQSAVWNLEQTLRQTDASCTEVSTVDYQWLQKAPNTIINNWALSSLALVIQDRQPRKLLLAQNDCEPFYQLGMIQVDPWSQLSADAVIPPLK